MRSNGKAVVRPRSTNFSLCNNKVHPGALAFNLVGKLIELSLCIIRLLLSAIYDRVWPGASSMKCIRWVFLIFLGIVPLSARAQQQQANTEKPLTDTQKLGQRIFEQRCGICHAPARGAFVMYGPYLYKGLINGSEDAIKQMIITGTSKSP